MYVERERERKRKIERWINQVGEDLKHLGVKDEEILPFKWDRNTR